MKIWYECVTADRLVLCQHTTAAGMHAATKMYRDRTSSSGRSLFLEVSSQCCTLWYGHALELSSDQACVAAISF